MATQARRRIKGLEAEWTRPGPLADLPDVDSHALERRLELVDECDVDGPVHVLDNLGGFGQASRGDTNNPFHRLPIKGGGELEAGRGHAPHYFRDGGRRIVRIP